MASLITISTFFVTCVRDFVEFWNCTILCSFEQIMRSRTSTLCKHSRCFHSYRIEVEQNWSLNDKRLSKNLIPLLVHRWIAQSHSAASAAFGSTTPQSVGSLHCISSRMTPVDRDWQIGTKTVRSQDEQLKRKSSKTGEKMENYQKDFAKGANSSINKWSLWRKTPRKWYLPENMSTYSSMVTRT